MIMQSLGRLMVLLTNLVAALQALVIPQSKLTSLPSALAFLKRCNWLRRVSSTILVWISRSSLGSSGSFSAGNQGLRELLFKDDRISSVAPVSAALLEYLRKYRDSVGSSRSQNRSICESIFPCSDSVGRGCGRRNIWLTA
ncbi:hypothetical protein AMK68_04760 [candidate division KD3-62 bacterium DG_56]|uniref:Uncharacterized protein n=1 Tax=candidate division KD3-62 bacterium DG_56 TaxID=1704032 RepID=A0A0S7XK53_9BACT|nr:MAG: hypothetical protein AMK68_04760 [candidate division KD3-62 bacterium DG_56]